MAELGQRLFDARRPARVRTTDEADQSGLRPNRGDWRRRRRFACPDNVYKVIELIGTSDESWEKAAKAAVERAGVRICR